jgi:hypothetical protein
MWFLYQSLLSSVSIVPGALCRSSSVSNRGATAVKKEEEGLRCVISSGYAATDTS